MTQLAARGSGAAAYANRDLSPEPGRFLPFIIGLRAPTRNGRSSPDSIPAKCGACREGRELPVAITVAFQPIVDVHAGRVYG